MKSPAAPTNPVCPIVGDHAKWGSCGKSKTYRVGVGEHYHAVYLVPRFELDPTSVHDAGAASEVTGMLSGFRLLLVSRLLNPSRSAPSIFHASKVAVSSLHPVSHVSICALVGGMSIPFCPSGAR